MDIIEVVQTLTLTITIHIQALAIQMAMDTTRAIILHLIIIHQHGIHQVIMMTITILDITIITTKNIYRLYIKGTLRAFFVKKIKSQLTLHPPLCLN